MQRGAWFAVNLSLLFPGLGQLYLGQRLRGLVWLGGGLAGLAAVFWAYLAPQGNVQVGAGLLGMGFMLWLFNLIDAHACGTGSWKGNGLSSAAQAPSQNRLSSFGLFKGQAKSQSSAPSSLGQDRWFLVFLSQILPGLGQLYQGQYWLALIFLGLSLVAITVLAGQLGLILGIPALAAFAVFQLASAGDGLSAASQGRFQRWGVQMALVVFVGRSLFFAAVPISRHFVEPFSVPSESMVPTLMVGDRILVDKRSNYRPKPGDIVVFRAPAALMNSTPINATSATSPSGIQLSGAQSGKESQPETEFFVKRVVGVGGDRIQVEPGETRRNGQLLTETYIYEAPQYSWDSGAIASNSLVVLGDNRNASLDSSRWGTLPGANVLGRAYRISWPPERSRPLP